MRRFVSVTLSIATIGVSVAIWLIGVRVQPQPAPGKPRMIRGFVAAITDPKLSDGPKSAAAFPGREVYLPGAAVFARDLATRTESEAVRTDLSGRFTLWVTMEGRYQICWKAPGFVDECSSTIVSVGNTHAYAGTQHARALAAQNTTVVFGAVRLMDGSLPRSLDPLVNLNAFATVNLLDSAGNATAKTLVNNFGDYIIPQVPLRRDIALRAATSTFSTDLTLRATANLVTPFTRIDIRIADTPPRLEPLAAFDSTSKRVKVATPGATVHLKTAARDVENDPIKFIWNVSAGSGQLSAIAGAAADWTLPAQPGLYTATVLADDGKGGITRSALSLRADTRGIPFSGRVTVLGGAPSPSTRIDVNGRVAQTNSNGEFRLFVADAPRFVLNIKRQGYGLISRVYDNAVLGGTWTLMPGTLRTVNPAQIIRVSDERSPRHCPGPLSSALDWKRFPTFHPQFQDGKSNAVPAPGKSDAVLPETTRESLSQKPCGPGIEVEIPANSLVDSAGNAPTGIVQVVVTTVDLNSPEQMPGDDTVTLANGTNRALQSYGAGTIDAFSGNRPLNLKTGTSATIRIPIDPSQLAAGGPIPATIPLLTYDERPGVWKEDGMLTRAGNFYAGSVKHFSAFNSDLVKSNQSCVRVLSPSLPATYKLEYTIPQTGGAAPVVRTFNVTNTTPNLHVIYNLPSNTNITLVPVDLTTNVPIGIFIVSTGGQQNPTSPNLPAFPYAACSTEVTLSNQILPEVPNNGEFLHGLFSFEATNLDELNTAIPAQAALKDALDTASANYYAQIDPRGKRTTFNAFKTTNGFPTGELHATYANSTDLGFGRDMHCRKSGSDVACYVTNYGNIGTPDSSDVLEAIAGTTPVATVAMEYSQIESPLGNPNEFDDPTRAVKFYVYNAAGNPIRAANLDGLGARPVPQLCMVCHGGIYPVPPALGNPPVFNTRDSAKLGSQFLPFDLNGYTYAAAPFDKASQQAVFKQLNENIVKNTPPDSVISDLITEWYSGGTTQNEVAIVSGWNGSAAEQAFYRDTLGRTCRTCHVTNLTPELRFNLSSQLKDNLGSAESRVCLDHVMPHAKVTHDKFWKSVGPNMVAQFQAFGEAFKTAINGWNGTECGPFTPGGSTPLSAYQTDVQPIFDAHCISCHSGSAPSAGLNLAAALSYNQLVGVASTELPSMNRVTPNSTVSSYLFHKISGTQGSVGGSGGRMPLGSGPLSATDIGKIQTWINSGANP